MSQLIEKLQKMKVGYKNVPTINATIELIEQLQARVDELEESLRKCQLRIEYAQTALKGASHE